MVEDVEQTSLVEGDVGLGIEVLCAFGASVECGSCLNGISEEDLNSFVERLLIDEDGGDIEIEIDSEVVEFVSQSVEELLVDGVLYDEIADIHILEILFAFDVVF